MDHHQEEAGIRTHDQPILGKGDNSEICCVLNHWATHDVKENYIQPASYDFFYLLSPPC